MGTAVLCPYLDLALILVKSRMQKRYHWLALFEMLLDDRCHILRFNSTIPNFGGQHSHGCPHVALSLTFAANDGHISNRGRQKLSQHLG